MKKSILTLLVASVIIIGCASPVSAATQSRIISGSSQAGITGWQTTTTTTARVYTVPGTNAEHKKGASTTISTSSSQTTSLASSVSLTAGVDAVFATMSTSMGVTSSTSITTGTTISYTVDKNTANGKYRMEHVFPCDHVKQEKKLSDKNGTRVTWSRTISYAPRTSAAYRRLTRYAN